MVTENCVVCSGPIGSSFVRNEWDESICMSHASLPGCLWCGSHSGVNSQNGIYSCQKCRNCEVNSSSQISDCVNDVLNWFSMVVGPHVLDEVRVTYGGLEVPPPSGGTLGWTSAQWNGSKGQAEILTVPFVPAPTLHQILAHEYAHVVLIFDPKDLRPHRRSSSDEVFVEGTCEVFAHEYLKFRSDDQSLRLAERIERNPHSIYGEGYRSVAKQFSHLGSLASLVSHATDWSIPATVSVTRTFSPVTNYSATGAHAPTKSRISIPSPTSRVTKEHRPIIEMNQNLVPSDKVTSGSERPSIRMKRSK